MKKETIALMMQMISFLMLLTLLVSNLFIGQKMDKMIELLKQIAEK